MVEMGSQSQFFFWQHLEYYSWESTEKNDTTHGGSWGGGGAWGPPLAYGLLLWENKSHGSMYMYVSLRLFDGLHGVSRLNFLLPDQFCADGECY